MADVVRVLARGRGGHVFEPRGSLDLKGLPEPLAAWAVPWTPTSAGTDLRRGTPWVGRESERRTIGGLIDLARDGAGGTLLVAGEPGIGKTRLVAEAAQQAAASGFTVLWGGCHDGDVTAHAAFAEVLTAWARSAPVELVGEAIAAEGPTLATLSPALRDVLADLPEASAVEAEAAVERLHDAVCQWLLRLSTEGPLVLVLDDLHWADDATVRLLRTVARRTRRARVLIIGTYRETDLDRGHPLADALPLLRREVEPARIALDGLTVDDVHALLERLAGHDVPVAFAGLLEQHCDGNPFFIRETLLHLAEEGRIAVEGGTWVATTDDLGIPEGVREVLGRRLSRLSKTTNDVLAVGALFEVAFSLPVAAAVLELEEEAALDAVDEALAAQIVRPAEEFDSYAFTHALFRHTLVAELSPSRQVRLHRAIAEAIERAAGDRPTPAQAASLARHFGRSSVMPGAERGVPYALLAVEDAEARAAHREAYELLVLTRELLAEGDERTREVQERLVRAAVLGGVSTDTAVAEGERLLDLVRTTDGGDAAATALHDALRGGTDDIRVLWRLADLALAAMDPDRRDIAWAWFRHWQLNRDEQATGGMPLDSPERREVMPVLLGHFGTYMAMHAERPELLRRLADPDIDPGDRVSLLWAAGVDAPGLATCARESYEKELARGVLTQALPAAVIAVRAMLVAGLHDEADALLAEASALLPRVAEDSNGVFQLLACYSFAADARGQPLSSAAFTLQESDNPNVSWTNVTVRAAKALALTNEERADEAIGMLDEVARTLEMAAPWAPNLPLTTDIAVRVHFELDRRDHLDVLERVVWEKVLEPDAHYLETEPHATAAQVAALRGRHDEARALFDAAYTNLEASGATSTIVRVAYYDALHEARAGAAGDADRLDAAVTRARAGAAHPAMAPWHERIDRVLAER